MDLSKIKVISWDLDGTLYSLPSMKIKFIGIVLKQFFSLNLDAIKEFYELWRLHKKIRFYRYHDKCELGDDDIQNFCRISSKWYGRAIKQTGAFLDIEKVVNFLSDKKQVIVSDYRVEGKIDQIFKKPFWEKSYAGIDLGHLKPSSFMLQQVIDDYGIAPDELLHIGDKVMLDGVAAKNIGCKYLILNSDFKNYKNLYQTMVKQCTT
jgi:FMN phosphatase YigB (HAD superfamily)